MRRVTTGAAAACSALALTAVGLGATGHMRLAGRANADGTTMLVGATLTIDHTSLSGTELAVMTVTVHLTDTNGVPSTYACPCAGLQAVDAAGQETSLDPQAVNDRDVSLSLRSGSLKDGYWSGQTTVGAINAGDWQLTGLNAGSIADYTNEQDQRGFAKVPGKAFGAEVSFTGSHWPELTLTMPQTPVTYPTRYVVSGSAHWSDTHEPIPNLTLSWEPGRRSQIHQGTPPVPVTTDANGMWSRIDRQPLFEAAIAFAPDGLGRYTQWASQAVATGHTERYLVTLIHHGRHVCVSLQPNYAIDHELAPIERWNGTKWQAIGNWDILNSCQSSYTTVTSSGRYRATFPTDDGAETIGNTSAVVTVS